MNLIITFSGRENGNCQSIAQFISKNDDRIIDFKKLNYHNCSSCNNDTSTNKQCPIVFLMFAKLKIY